MEWYLIASISLKHTGWAKKVIPLVHVLHCTRGITFLAHQVYVLVVCTQILSTMGLTSW